MNGEPRKSAAIEALAKIKEAEERAQAIVREAREILSVEIIKEATREAEEIKITTLARAKEDAETHKNVILEKAVEEAGKIRAEARKETAEMRRRASERMAEAVKKTSLKVKEFLERRPV